MTNNLFQVSIYSPFSVIFQFYMYWNWTSFPKSHNTIQNGALCKHYKTTFCVVKEGMFLCEIKVKGMSKSFKIFAENG